MKIVAVIIIAGLLGICRGAQQNQSEGALVISAGDWVLCEKEEAEYIAHVRYSFSDVISETEHIQYVRAKRPAKLISREKDGSEVWSCDGGFSQTDGFCADGQTKTGEGCGYSGSVGLGMKGSIFVLSVDLYWDVEKDRGHYQKEWDFCELKTCSVADGRFRADIRIEKKPANQALQHNDPSCHESCLRTPRASWGRG